MTTRHQVSVPHVADAEERRLTASVGRQAHRVAGELTVLAARAGVIPMTPDPHAWEDVVQVADSLRALALRCARAADDPDLLEELAPRRWQLPEPPDRQPARARQGPPQSP